jgi:hypothetical protein
VAAVTGIGPRRQLSGDKLPLGFFFMPSAASNFRSRQITVFGYWPITKNATINAR